jgi:hypothetical protein
MFLLRFLRVNKFSMRKATSMLDSYIKMRCDYPHWYQGLGNWESDSRFMELVIILTLVYSYNMQLRILAQSRQLITKFLMFILIDRVRLYIRGTRA